MKTAKSLSLTAVAAVIMITALTHCTEKTPVVVQPFSADEEETAKKEIAGRIEEIIEGGKKLDIDAAIKPYDDSDAFRLVTPDGRVTDYATMKKEQLEFSKQLTSLLFTTVKQDFNLLSKTLLLCTWTGTNEFELKTGERFKIDPYVGSMLFSKTGGEWKIIYAHESAAPPVQTNVTHQP